MKITIVIVFAALTSTGLWAASVEERPEETQITAVFMPIAAFLSDSEKGLVGATIGGGVSDDGTVIAGGSGEPGDRAFFLRFDEDIQWIPDLLNGGTQSWSEGLSEDGQFIIGSSLDGSSRLQAFRWGKMHGTQGLGFLDHGTFSSAAAISNDGTIVVGEADTIIDGALTTVPFVWTSGDGMTALGAIDESNPSGAAYALSAAGSIIVGRSGGRTFFWTEEDGMEELGRLSDHTPSEDVVCAVNIDGRILAGGAVSKRSSPNLEAFIYDQDGIQEIGDLQGGMFSSIVYALSADGQIAVGEGTTDRGNEAFIWDKENGMRHLATVLESGGMSLDGWILHAAVAISADGSTIVGGGEKDGIKQGWYAKLAKPERVW